MKRQRDNAARFVCPAECSVHGVAVFFYFYPTGFRSTFHADVGRVGEQLKSAEFRGLSRYGFNISNLFHRVGLGVLPSKDICSRDVVQILQQSRCLWGCVGIDWCCVYHKSLLFSLIITLIYDKVNGNLREF